MATLVTGARTVTVPATSANLGPGYDSLGLALSLRDTLSAEVVDGPLVIDVEGEGADTLPRDGQHLVVQAMRLAFEAMETPQPSVRLSCRNVIPQSRGLGSSSAAIVGGLALARALVEGGEALLPDADLFQLAAEIEGHADNVAPALFGGFVITGRARTGEYFSVRSPVSPAISAVALIPPTTVETKVARRAIPATVPHAEAAANAGRAALLVAALAGSPEHLLAATRDYLHQEYRREVMPASMAVVDALRADRVPAIISGAGPTVLAFSDGVDSDATRALLDATPEGWRGVALSIDARGVVLS